LSGEDLEVVKRLRGQEPLLPEHSERERRPLVPPQHPWPGQTVRLEQVSHRDAKRVGNPPQGSDARTRPATFDLAQEALAEARPFREDPEREPPKAPKGLESLADVYFA